MEKPCIGSKNVVVEFEYKTPHTVGNAIGVPQ
jgi:hypothetical protein